MRTNPFKITGPALISFSGGRTSAYLLRRILDEGLDQQTFAVFADTGRERDETYDFVRECSRRWRVPVFWVRRPGYFDQLIADKKALPNTVQRFCTEKPKLGPIWQLGKGLGFTHWNSIIGIRADEPRRVAKIRGRKPMAFEDVYLPLADAGVTLAEVTAFWKAQPFDLALQPYEGNCTLCFLKSQGKRVRIMQDRPDLAEWWIAKERETGRFFRAPPRPSYAQLLQRSQLPMLPGILDEDEDDLPDCICGS